MSEEEAVKEDSRRKRRKRSKGSQTSEENESAACSCHDCASMTHSIASTGKKLDKALRSIQEISKPKNEAKRCGNQKQRARRKPRFSHF